MHNVTGVLYAAAQTAPGKPSDWKETASWVLGLPVALVAVDGTIYTIPKVRRENRKLDLEILEKERALGMAREEQDPIQVARLVSEPAFISQKSQILVLRFVLLYLLLQAWGVVQTLLESASNSAQFALSRAVNNNESVVAIIGYIIAVVFASTPGIVASLLFVVIGWPLLLEISQVLHFELPEFFYRKTVRRFLIAIAFLAGVAQSVVGVGFTLL